MSQVPHLSYALKLVVKNKGIISYYCGSWPQEDETQKNVKLLPLGNAMKKELCIFFSNYSLLPPESESLCPDFKGGIFN